MKKVLAGLLAVMLVVGGIYVVPAQVDEVQAAETEVTLETGVALQYTDDSTTEVTYDATVANPMPVPVSETYQDYLFAGWFKDATCTADNAVSVLEMAEAGVESGYYAKFVPRDTLNVKFQIANGTIADTDANGNPISKASAIRFISSVDSLDYQSIGFEVSGCEKPYSSSTVYERIDSTMSLNGAKKEYTFSPKIVGTESEYFFTAKLGVAVDDATDYTVKAYWITLDGTKVYGDARVVGLEDGAENVLNLTVNGTVSGTTATVTNYTSATGTVYTSAATVKVLSANGTETCVRVVLDDTKTVDGLTSASVVAIGDAKGIYRNYNTSHTSGTATAPGSDVSWYYAELALDESAEYFVIATSADLYGFAKLVDSSVLFSGYTVTLIGDVIVNTGKASSAWLNDSSVYHWNSIGASGTGKAFAGTFDGDENVVSGLFLNVTTDYNGLFGHTLAGAVIQNVSLINSYMRTTNNYLGLVGYARGCEFYNLFCDAEFVLENPNENVGETNYAKGCVGGIAGRVVNGNTHIIQNCWFDGDIIANGNIYGVGGLVGQHMSDTVGETYTNCLYTGTINSNAAISVSPTIGGLFGAHQSTATYSNRVIATNNCIIAGKITVKHSLYTTYTGQIAGYVGGSKSISFVNSYSVCNAIYEETEKTTVISSDYGNIRSNSLNKWVTWTKTADLKNTALNALFGEEHVWTRNENIDVPILKQFEDLWLSKQTTNN